MKPPQLLITIDTEEDDWGLYNRPSYSVSNIEKIPRLQALFDKFGVRPTYLISYPVATLEPAIKVLRPIVERKRCEIGAHCHPWNTPPVIEERTPQNSMLCNLDSGLQLEKLTTLKGAIREHYGVTPTSFRAGRWGFDAQVGHNLAALGFLVDSSVTPYMSWKEYHGPDFNRPYPERYKMSLSDVALPDTSSPLTQIPTTTGFTGMFGYLGYSAHRTLAAAPLRLLKARGIAAKLKLFSMTWLCPEMTGIRAMIDLTTTILNQDGTILNLMFHSATLKAGITPFVRTAEDEERFLKRIEAYLQFCQRNNFQSFTLSELAL